MKKILLRIPFIFFLFVSVSIYSQRSFYDFIVLDINGDEYDLAQLQGKKVLVVNTSSKCGLTYQFANLEKLYKEYGSDQFVILGFPSGDFGGFELDTNAEIAEFCITKYGVSFPMMSKISVKGDDKHPLFKWLTEASENGVEDSKVAWNFQKYMVDEGGMLVGHIPPRKKPTCRKITSWLKH